jgi:hypothetical protein
MLDWNELEVRFLALQTEMPHVRIDHQTGSAGENWRFSGNAAGSMRARFYDLAGIAGRKLAEMHPNTGGVPELRQTDPASRWFALLEATASAASPVLYAEQTGNDGTALGPIILTRVENPLAESARLCVRLAAVSVHDDARAAARQPRLQRVWSIATNNPLASAIIGAVIAGLILSLFF